MLEYNERIWLPGKEIHLAFREIPGITGKVYVPDAPAEEKRDKKHACEDCFYCQWCSDDRCELCLSRRNCDAKKKKGECK